MGVEIRGAAMSILQAIIVLNYIVFVSYISDRAVSATKIV